MVRHAAILILAASVLAGCGAIHPAQDSGAANATAAQGLGEGPIGEVPTNGAFGPDQLSP